MPVDPATAQVPADAWPEMYMTSAQILGAGLEWYHSWDEDCWQLGVDRSPP